MALLRGLYKMFSKRERFAPPKKYKLSSKELESVLIFFAILFMLFITLIITVFS